MLKKWILIFSLVISLSFVWAQVPIFNECVTPFTDLPTDWTSNDGGGNPVMQTGTGGYLLVDHVDDWVVTKAYDLSPFNNIELSIKVATYGQGDANPLTIEVSNDNGATWTYQSFVTDTPTSSTYISSGPYAVSSTDTQVKFRFRRDAETGKGVRFREILLQGNPQAAFPLLTVSPETLTGFSYEEDSGPSAEQSFSISGVDLDGNVSITAPTNYAISLITGSGFSNSVTINHVAGTVATTTVYVRMIAGLTAGYYNNETIDITAGTANPKTVTLSGIVTSSLPTDGYLVNFDGAGETKISYASGTVNLSGLDWDMSQALIGDSTSDFLNGIRSARFSGKATSSMTMLADKTGGLGTLSFPYRRYGTEAQVAWKVEYSSDAGSTWTQIGEDFTATADVQTFSELVNVAGNVRIKISLVTDSGTAQRRLNIDDILLTDYIPGGPTPILYATGEVDPLSNILGNPGDEIGIYHLSGTNVAANIGVTAPLHFEIATSEEGPWSSTLSLSPTFDANIYVRLNSDILGEHAGDITHNSPGATAVTMRVTGETFAPGGEITVTQTLVPFTQELGAPSAVQSYTLQGTALVGPITVNAEAPFEISANGSTGWAASLDFAANFNGPVYIRLNSAVAGTFDATIEHLNDNAAPASFIVSGTATPPAGEVANLFFSEYIEGSSSNKALEIFNAEGSEVDLTNYKVRLASNGNPWGNTLELTGTLAAGDVFVIANASAVSEILDIADAISTVTYFNGDDALGLFYGDTLIDVIGIPEENPHVKWAVAGVPAATDNHTLIRKPTVTQGNTDWPSSAGTTAGNSEWIVMEIDYFADLGIHTYTPGVQYAAAPAFDPAAGTYTDPINVSLSSTTAGATIRYTVDGSNPSTTLGTIYNSSMPISVSTTTTIKAVAYATGYEVSNVVSATYTYISTVQVANIAALRAGAADGTIYELTGEAILTYKNAARNVKYIQDATAAIVIDDYFGIITTEYNLYDGITGITGTLNLYSGMLQFVPVADPGAATSVNNTVVPEVRTLASLTNADQGKLIKVQGATITYGTNTDFPATAANLDVSDATASLTLRTFVNTDYANTPIPAAAVNLIGLVGQFNADMQVSPRFLSDIHATGGGLDTPIVTIVRSGNNVQLNWTAITGATSYRIESSNDPYADFTQAGTTNNTAFSITAAAKKFFRVIALP